MRHGDVGSSGACPLALPANQCRGWSDRPGCPSRKHSASSGFNVSRKSSSARLIASSCRLAAKSVLDIFRTSGSPLVRTLPWQFSDARLDAWGRNGESAMRRISIIRPSPALFLAAAVGAIFQRQLAIFMAIDDGDPARRCTIGPRHLSPLKAAECDPELNWNCS